MSTSAPRAPRGAPPASLRPPSPARGVSPRGSIFSAGQSSMPERSPDFILSRGAKTRTNQCLALRLPGPSPLPPASSLKPAPNCRSPRLTHAPPLVPAFPALSGIPHSHPASPARRGRTQAPLPTPTPPRYLTPYRFPQPRESYTENAQTPHLTPTPLPTLPPLRLGPRLTQPGGRGL